MSKQTTEEMKAALDAFERDGSVQTKRPESKEWVTTDAPVWNFDLCEYRPCPPKPESRKPRECVIRYSQATRKISPWGIGMPVGHEMEEDEVSEILHMREVMPDEPQIDRTPWMLSTDGFGIFDGDGVLITTACTREGAARIVSAHNRAIGIKEEQA